MLPIRAESLTLQTIDSSGNRPLRLLKYLLVGLGLALAVAAVLEWSGASSSVDATLRRKLYALRGHRPSNMSVVLVEVDDRSISAWGPLPWPQEHYAKVTTEIAKGRPRVIALVEPPALIWRPGTTAIIPELFPILAPPVVADVSDTARKNGAAGTVEWLALDTVNDTPTLLAKILYRAGHAVPSGRELPVNYLGPGARAPLLSALSVADGQVQPSVFEDKIVLIGMADTDAALALATPVGPMTWAEIHAHALLGVEDNAVWQHFSTGWRWAQLAAYVWLAMLVLYGRSLRTLVVASVLLLLLPTAVAYAGFASGTWLLDITGPTVAVAVAISFLGALRLDEMHARRRLARLAAEAVERADARATSDERFWEQAARLGEIYFETASSILAELVPGTTQLHFHRLTGTSADEIAETNRDVLRPPFREPYLTASPVTVTGFMAPEQKVTSMLVPLVAGPEVVGFWILNFHEPHWPGADEEDLIATFSQEIGHNLANRRAMARPRGNRKQAARGSMPHTVQVIAADLSAGAAAERLSRQVFRDMPAAVLTATPWMDIENTNRLMQQILTDRDISLAEVRDLIGLLTELTQKPPETCRAQVRDVAATRAPVRLDVPSTSYVFRMGWIHGNSDEGGAPLSRVVLTATTAHEQAQAQTNSLPSDVVDLFTVIVQTVRRVRTEVAEFQRSVRVEFTSPMPRVGMDAEPIIEALSAVLRDMGRHGRNEVPCTLAVESEDDTVLLVMIDPSYAIPQSALPGLLLQSNTGSEAKNSLGNARERLLTLGGDLEVESFFGSGVLFRIQLPRKG